MDLDLYVITDEVIATGRTHAEIARLACDGGADAIHSGINAAAHGHFAGNRT